MQDSDNNSKNRIKKVIGLSIFTVTAYFKITFYQNNAKC